MDTRQTHSGMTEIFSHHRYLKNVQILIAELIKLRNQNGNNTIYPQPSRHSYLAWAVEKAPPPTEEWGRSTASSREG
jgi:hypothetical protein